MELDQKPPEVDSEVSSETQMENCRKRCCELEERCVELESNLQNRNIEFQLLETRVRALEAEKIVTVDEIRVLEQRNLQLQEEITRVLNESKVSSERNRELGNIVDLTEEDNDEEKVVQLMIENKVLDCEKKRAETETRVWKVKCEELESRVVELQKEVSALSSVFGKKMSEESELKMEEKVVDGKGTEAAAIGGSSCCPVEGVGELQVAGMSSVKTPSGHSIHVEEGKRNTNLKTELCYNRRVRKQLAFGEDGYSPKKTAPSMPGEISASVHVIDICDSNDEPDTISSNNPNLRDVPTASALGCTKDDENKLPFKNLLCQSDEEDMGGYKGNFPYVNTPTPKRKRAPNIVVSESESDNDNTPICRIKLLPNLYNDPKDSDDDDDIPICKVKMKRLQKVYHEPTDSQLNSCSVTATVSESGVKESVTRMRPCEIKGGSVRKSARIAKASETKNCPSIPTNEDVEDDEMVEDGSESEGESLGGFLVDSDGAESSKSSVSDKASCESENVSDDNTDFSEILSRIQRNKGNKSKWEFEADMLAAFGKEPELCMKAVCALYRQQTSEERSSKETIYTNQRGFSQCDALRGSTIAEFLIDGDREGDVKKSVEELQEYYPRGVEVCRTLATRYSKQLFAIYTNKEDPLFLPD